MSRIAQKALNEAGQAAAQNSEVRDLMNASARLAGETARILSEVSCSDERLYWLQTMVDHIPDDIYIKDTSGRFLIANRHTALANGFDNPAGIIGKTDFDIHGPELAQTFFDLEQEVIQSGVAVFGVEQDAVPLDGRQRWVLTSKVPLRRQDGEIIGIVGASRDITERRKSEQLMMGQARLMEMMATSWPLNVLFVELILLIESQLSGVTGSILLVSPDGETLIDGCGPHLDPDYIAKVNGLKIGEGFGSCGTCAHRGEPVFVSDIQTDPLWTDFHETAAAFDLRSCWSSPIRNSAGDVIGTFALYKKEISFPNVEELDMVAMATHLAGVAIDSKRSAERILFLAHHDPLTGLANRIEFDEQIPVALEQARVAGTRAALGFFDLDNFKMVNDSLGHRTGDALLKLVGERATACLRPGDLVARIGGDEFVVLLLDVGDDDAAITQRLEAFRQAISTPATIADQTFRITNSMGVAFFPEHGSTPDTLIANADAAMYRAKEVGRDNLQLFNPNMVAADHERFRRVEDLRLAIERGEFLLHYQPQVSIATGQMFGVEALLRWERPGQGMVSPGEFIPLAEETGLILAIGDWALDEACRQNKAWQDQGLPPLVMSVNVSARQFCDRDWISRVEAALARSGLDPRWLELEITESLIMADVRMAVATMHALEALGIELAIDDFGTGYSSLSALKRFPVTRLKIDRSFVKDIPKDTDDMAITGAIISLAQKLGMRVIAEGVETKEQVDFLASSGCDEIQGYFYSRPVTAASVETLLVSGRRLG